MLDYLVTSKVRRRLLKLLWADAASGSVKDLAARARVGFASAYRELRAMQAEQLAVSVRENGVELFQVNNEHPLADQLHALVAAGRTRPANSDKVRDELFTLGAPLFGEVVPVPDVEEALVRGVQLAHRDGTVASVLPVCFYKQRDVLRPAYLVECARDAHEKRALGFFLDLTAELSADRRFSEWAKNAHDGRCTAADYLFEADKTSRNAREVAERRTPKVAHKWGLRMNMGLDAFESMFRKHAHA